MAETTDDGPNGLPSVNSIIVVIGNDAIIERREQTPGFPPEFRLLHIAETGVLALNDLTLRKARNFNGAGFRNHGTVTLINSTVSGNDGGVGGGFSNSGTGTG